MRAGEVRQILTRQASCDEPGRSKRIWEANAPLLTKSKLVEASESPNCDEHLINTVGRVFRDVL